jgi:hypothetical protein
METVHVVDAEICDVIAKVAGGGSSGRRPA